MKINWTVRFRNKTWLTSALALIATFVFDVLALLDVAPAITQDSVMQLITVVLGILSGIGVVVDPTTPGVKDSERAMLYSKPGEFELEDADEQ